MSKMGRSRIASREFCQQYGDCPTIVPTDTSTAHTAHERYAAFVANPKTCKKTERHDARAYKHFMQHKRNLVDMIREAHPAYEPQITTYTSGFRHRLKKISETNRSDILPLIHDSIRFAQTENLSTLTENHLMLAYALQ